MDFALKDVLGALGPNAALVFASWIFMTFLQSRYSDTYSRYRALINDAREGKVQGKRRETIHDEIGVYRRRIDQMRRATDLGLYAAVLLLATLIIGALDVVFKSPPGLKYVGAACPIVGLAFVIWSALLVAHDNHLIKMPLARETDDLPEFANGPDGHRPG
jgi:hypothetical protein